MPQAPLASSRARSTKWRDACIVTRWRSEAEGFALDRPNLSLSPSISRRTRRCQGLARRPAVPDQHPVGEKVGDHLALLAVTQRHPPPGDAGCAAAQASTRVGATSVTGRLGARPCPYDQPPAAPDLEIDGLVGMHLDQKALAFAFQFREQPRQVPVAAIAGHPVEVQAVPPARRIMPSAISPLLRNAVPPQAPRHRRNGPHRPPNPRQEQLGVDQAGRLAIRHRREYAHLTVIDFPQTAIPLPGNAGRCLAFLGKTALVEHQCPAALREVRLRLTATCRRLPRDPSRTRSACAAPLVVATATTSPMRSMFRRRPGRDRAGSASRCPRRCGWRTGTTRRTGRSGPQAWSQPRRPERQCI